MTGDAVNTAARLQRVRTRRGARRLPLGVEAPLIGRDEELRLLQGTVRRAERCARYDSRPWLGTLPESEWLDPATVPA